MDPISDFSTVIKRFIGLPLQLISFNFIEPNFKPSLLTILSSINTVMFPIFSVTTCLETDINQCTQSIVMGVIGSQCSAKACFAILNHVGVRENIKLITKLYEANKADGVNKDDLRKSVRINLLLAKLFVVGILGTELIIILAPICIYVFTGQIMPIMPVKIPFISTDTFLGYTLHIVFHLFSLVTGGLGLVGLDTFMITTTIHIWPMTRILERATSDLNGATQCLKQDSVKNSVWLKLRMRNIILMHKEICFYVRSALDMSYALTTAELYTDQTILIILIFCILKLKWIPGMLVFVCGFVKLLVFCMIGTAVEYFNDKTYDALANIDSTMLPEAEKKNIIIMLHAAQHPPQMKAGLVEMNLSLFVEVIKTIYSVSMLLMEFL